MVLLVFRPPAFQTTSRLHSSIPVARPHTGQNDGVIPASFFIFYLIGNLSPALELSSSRARAFLFRPPR